jgi:hypothetical protein
MDYGTVISFKTDALIIFFKHMLYSAVEDTSRNNSVGGGGGGGD